MQLRALPALVIVPATLFVAGCSQSPPSATPSKRQKVTLFAAASTKEPVERLAAEYEKRHGTKVVVQLGPSSGLAKQIEQGGDADLFLSADQASVDHLAGNQLVERRRDLLMNRLVVVAPADSKLELKQLADLADAKFARLALAEPKVPAGEYARQALAKVGVLDRVKDRVIGGADVRATLQFVVRGEVDVGVVYATDAVAAAKVRALLDIPAHLHAPIVYPLAVVKRTPANPAAVRVFEFFASAEARQAFEQAKFGWAE